MSENPVKARLAAGGIALGMNVRLARSGDVARIAKSSGHDFLFIDMQHGLYDVETVGHIAHTALGCGVAPLVRVRSCDARSRPGEVRAGRQTGGWRRVPAFRL